MNKLLACVSVAVLGVTAYGGVEWFVDRNRPDDTGDGKSEATAFRRIKTAIAKASNGDTITVLPGEYGENESLTDEGTVDIVNAWSQNNRVYVNRQVTLRSRDGAATTHIVGRWDGSNEHGMGPNGVRCFGVAVSCTVTGFTIRDGASNYAGGGSDQEANRGGAVYASGAGVFTDCVISNCVGTRGGAAYQGKYVRCVFENNYGTAYGAAMRDASAFNCLFTHNRAAIGTATDPGAVAYPHDIVNCTIVNNATKGIKQVTAGTGHIVNTINLNNTSVGEGISVGPTTWLYSVTDNGNVKASGTSCIQTTTGEFFSPASGDYRLVTGALSVGAGSLEQAGLYFAAYTNGTDLAGRPFATDGRVSAGAFQEAVDPSAYSGLMVGGDVNYGAVFVNGHEVYGTQEYRSAKYPEIVRLAFAPKDGFGLICFSWDDNAGADWPLENDEVYTLKPQTGLKNLTLRPGAVKWVDDDNAGDAAADGSAEHPYCTLNQATRAQNGSWLIKVRDGVYETDEYESNGLRNRLWVNQNYWTRVRSVNGASKTFIVGAPDPQGENGIGPGAIRCCCLGGSTQVQGFTLTDGHTDTGGDDFKTRGGGVYCLGEAGQTLVAVTDCVISNCVGNRGAAIFGGTLERCLLTANISVGNGVLRNCTAYTSLIAKNEDPLDKGVVGYSANLYQCSVIDNRTGSALQTPAGGETLAASVFAATRDNRDASGQYGSFKNSVIGTSGAATLAGNVIGDPMLADVPGGDYRVYAASPAAHFGLTENLRRAVDFTGRPYFLDADGKFTAGAFTEKLPCAMAGSTILDNAVSPSGLTPVTEEAEIEFSATGDRNLVGFEVDGVLVPDAAGARKISVPVRMTDETGDGKLTTVRAVYDTNWYVDAENGDDVDNTGYSWDSPKKTLAEAMKKVAAGDTLNAAPGVYKDGEMLQTVTGSGLGPYTPVVKARVVLEADRSLVSRDGPETTFIVGAADATGDADGLGDKAIRGVFLCDRTLLKGFTVTGGHTGSGAETMNACGGGIGGLGSTSVAENCIISNNVATRGASARYATLRRCRVFENRATGNAPAGRNVTACHCLFDRNVGDPVMSDMTLYNCTIGAANRTKSGGVPQTSWASPKCVNTIISTGAIVSGILSNCAYRAGVNVSGVGVNVSPAVGDLALDENGFPGRDSVAVDAGDLALVDARDDAAHDLAGGQRVYNGAMDIGCFEYDWRGDYARTLGGRRATVPSASPDVVEADDGKSVFIRKGTLQAVWDVGSEPCDCKIPFAITGNGTLAVSVNDGPATTYAKGDGVTAVELAGLSGATQLAFSYEPSAGDEGGVSLGRFKRGLGGLLIVR